MDTWASPWADDPGLQEVENGGHQSNLKQDTDYAAEAGISNTVNKKRQSEPGFSTPSGYAWADNDANPFAADEGLVWSSYDDTDLKLQEPSAAASFDDWKGRSAANDSNKGYADDISKEAPELKWLDIDRHAEIADSNKFPLAEQEAWSESKGSEFREDSIDSERALSKTSDEVGSILSKDRADDPNDVPNGGDVSISDADTTQTHICDDSSLQDDSGKHDKATVADSPNHPSPRINLDAPKQEDDAGAVEGGSCTEEDDDFGEFAEQDSLPSSNQVPFKEGASTITDPSTMSNLLTPFDFDINTKLVEKLYPVLPQSETAVPVHDIISTVAEFVCL